jgi:hypothetical protein
LAVTHCMLRVEIERRAVSTPNLLSGDCFAAYHDRPSP